MKRALALVLASTVAVAACGSDTDDDTAGDPSGDIRTIEVTMTDMAYTPASLDVEAGETIRFVFRNDGAVRHEAVFGTLAEQEAHHEEMAAMGGSHDAMDDVAMDGMDHGDMGDDAMDAGTMPHEEMTEVHGVLVEPGETIEVTHTFGASGPTMIGCHEPGHWEAGMAMTIDV